MGVHCKDTTAGTCQLWTAVTATFVSVTGTAMSAIAIPLFVLMTSGSGAAAGVVAFFELAPYLLAQFFGGPLVDRLGFRRVAVAGNAAAGLLLCSIPWLAIAGTPRLWVLCLVLALAGTARGIADVGSGALVPVLAGAGSVTMSRASALNNTAQRSGLVLGGLGGGLLLATTSPSTVILLDGVSFLLAALLFGSLSRIGSEATSSIPHPTESYRARLAAGFAFLFGQRLVRALVLMSAGTNLWAAAASGVLLQAWSLDRGISAGALGAVFAGFGLGQMTGGIISAAVGSRIPRFPAFVVGFLVGGPPIFLAPALSGSPLVVGSILLVSGIALGLVNPILGAVYYERIPVPLLARVLGTIRASVWVGVALGPLLGGVLVSAWGVGPTLWVSGIGYTALALAPLVVPVFRELSGVPGTLEPTDGATPDQAGTGQAGAAEEMAAAAPDSETRTDEPAPQISAKPRLPWPRSAETRPEPRARSGGPSRPAP